MQIIDESPLLKRLLVFVSALPFLVVLGLIVEAKTDFYPITQSISLYDYEFVLLWLLLAPFIYSIPSQSHIALMFVKKAYWFVFFALGTFFILGISIMFATNQI